MTPTLITLAHCDTWMEAHVLCGRLWSEDILAFATHQFQVGNNWAISIALGGIAVQVPYESAAAARVVVQHARNGEFEKDLRAIFDDLGDAKCPRCGAEKFRKRRPLGQTAISVVLTFYAGRTIFSPWSWLYICEQCGEAFRSHYGLIGKAQFDGFAKVFAEVTSADFDDMRADGVADDLLVAIFAEEAKGWLCRIDGMSRGWCIAKIASRSIELLTVDPNFIREGIGEGLHSRAVDWLFEKGAATITTSVSPMSRAEKFYRAFGWKLADLEEDGGYRMDITEAAWRLKMTRRRAGFWARLRMPAET